MNPCIDPLMNIPPVGTETVRMRRELDLSATRAAFTARAWHGAVRGTVPVAGGHIWVDAAGQPQSVHAELDLAGLSTGNKQRDKDLRSKRFFDTAQHPVMRFEANEVEASDGGWQVRGVLSISGTQCPVLLQVSRGGESDDGFTGTVTLTKHELGVRVPRPLVGTLVALHITAALLP